jgi:hypothetical protein
VGDRYLKVDAAVRARMVVVGHELPQDTVEVAFAPYEQPVQALGSCCAHKSFRERVRHGRSDGGLDDPGTDRTQCLVKGPDELTVTVTDKEAEGSALVFEGRYEVAGLLGDPGPDGVGDHAGQEHVAALHVDEEQHIDPSEHYRVDVENVARQGAGGLGS